MDEFIVRLREYAEWADANEWEVPICLGDDLRKTIEELKSWNEVLNIVNAHRKRSKSEDNQSMRKGLP